MAKFGQFFKVYFKKMYLSYWSHFTTSLLFTSYSAPLKKPGAGEGENYYGMCGIQEDKVWSFPPNLNFPSNLDRDLNLVLSLWVIKLAL